MITGLFFNHICGSFIVLGTHYNGVTELKNTFVEHTYNTVKGQKFYIT